MRRKRDRAAYLTLFAAYDQQAFLWSRWDGNKPVSVVFDGWSRTATNPTIRAKTLYEA